MAARNVNARARNHPDCKSSAGVRQNDTKILTNKQEKAARLAADDRLSDEQIAKQCGVTRSTIVRWKAEAHFAARVKDIADAYADRALSHWVARKVCRIGVLTELHDKMLQVIDERASSVELSSVPGGRTGLVTKTLKGIGKGDDFRIVEIYAVDTAVVKEIRTLQEQVAEELGQRVERTETIDLDKLFESMTRQEMEAYAKDGTVPDWVTSAVSFRRLISGDQMIDKGGKHV